MNPPSPPARLAPAAARCAYVVEERANPSSDYFVLPALARAGLPVVRCGFADLPPPAALAGAAVVFVRYVPAPWVRLVDAVRADLAQLVFFMDDDVLDVRASTGVPWRYRVKLARLAAWRSGWLRRQRAELWVSTPWLQHKYAAWQPRLIDPVPLPAATSACRVFYHGSASHEAEIRWLRPVIAAALERDPALAFEIVGGREVWRLYRDLPRVNVVHPMKWPAYQAFLATPGRDIGLAPALDVPFNRARACTKFFDITRCGAVGIYAPGGACASLVRHEREGLVVSMEAAAWTEAIIRLAADDALRQALLRNAQSRVRELGGADASA
jgi:glycosyltransferase involved in cell wall biosynthesis